MKQIEKAALIILKLLVFLVIISSATLSLRKEQHLADHPFLEDGYYSLSIARNVALGHGITIDNKTWSNGFQPLFTFMTVPAYWITGGDRYSSIRIVILISLLFYAASAFLFGSIIKNVVPGTASEKKLAFWAGAFVYITSLLLFIEHFNGLETGCLLFFILLLWRYYQTIDFSRTKDIFVFGLIMGLTVLARIDSTFLAFGLFLLLLLRPVSVPFKKRSTNALLFSATSFIVSLPWWLYNYIGFGSIMPTSGKAQQLFGIELPRISRAFSDLLQTLTVNTFTADRFIHGLAGNSIRAAVLAAIIFFLYRLLKGNSIISSDNTDKPKRTIGFIITLAFSYLALVFWYIYSSWASHFYLRYFSPVALIGAFGLALLLVLAFRHYPRLVITYCILSSLVIFISIYSLNARSGLRGNKHFLDQRTLILNHASRNSMVAAAQTGTVGYFLENTVNLDGKVNPEALRYQENMWQYLDKKGIKWFCDWKAYSYKYLGNPPEKNGWVRVDSLNDFYLYHRI